jgi:hypothetical protein
MVIHFSKGRFIEYLPDKEYTTYGYDHANGAFASIVEYKQSHPWVRPVDAGTVALSETTLMDKIDEK